MAKKQETTGFVIQEGFQTFASGEAVVSMAGDSGKPEEFQNFENLTPKFMNVSKSELDEKRQKT